MKKISQKRCKFLFDLYILCLWYKYKPHTLRGSRISWGAFLSLMIYLGYIEKREKRPLQIGYEMWTYLIDRTTVCDGLPSVPKKRRAAIAGGSQLLVTPVTPAMVDLPETYFRITVDATHHLSNRGVRYAERIAPKYRVYLTEEIFQKARDEMYPEVSRPDGTVHRFNPAAMKNANTAKQRVIEAIRQNRMHTS